MLLKKVSLMDECKFAYPKDLQNGKIEVTVNIILTSIFCVSGAAFCFYYYINRVSVPNCQWMYMTRSVISLAMPTYLGLFGRRKIFSENFDEALRYVNRCYAAELTNTEYYRPLDLGVF
ncbi:hypothetical protein DSUL_50114 [Desulfovibrionales bacterium]